MELRTIDWSFLLKQVLKNDIICLILLININVLAVSETEITNVKVNGESITCNNYICNATVNSEKVKIEYKLVDSEAKSSGFESGEEFTFTDSTMTKKLVVSKQVEGFETPISSEYVFNFTGTNECNKCSDIKGMIAVNGTCQCDSKEYVFNYTGTDNKNVPIKSNMLVYNVEVKYDVEDLKLEVVPNSSYAEVTIKNDLYFDLNDSNKVIDFVIKSEMGTEKEYRLIIIRENRPDTTIKSIKLSSGVIEIEKGVTDYKVNVPYDVNEIKIDVETTDPEAYFDIQKEDKLIVGSNLITINVSNKDVSSTYSITVNRLDNTDDATVNLLELKVDGYDLAFKPGVNEYDLYFDEIPKKLKITAVPVNENNAVDIPDNRNLSDGSTVHIKVSQISLGLSKEYLLHIHQNSIVNKMNLLFVIIPIVLIIVVIVVIIIVIIKSKKKKKEKKKKEEKRKIIENDEDFEII